MFVYLFVCSLTYLLLQLHIDVSADLTELPTVVPRVGVSLALKTRNNNCIIDSDTSGADVDHEMTEDNVDAVIPSKIVKDTEAEGGEGGGGAEGETRSVAVANGISTVTWFGAGPHECYEVR